MTVLLLALGCAQPSHLQYDFGRAYEESMKIQMDRQRPSVAKSEYPLSGTEGIKLRENVETETTEVKSGEAEKVQDTQ